LAINELPPSVRYTLYTVGPNSIILCRFSVKNVLLCGIWYCYDKPNMHTYLKPIIDTLNRLHKDGMFIHSDQPFYILHTVKFSPKQ
jgi:histidinol phosphatase-like enzyme